MNGTICRRCKTKAKRTDVKGGQYYAVYSRVGRNKEFFERAFNLQPKCMAMFGKEAEDIFLFNAQIQKSNKGL